MIELNSIKPHFAKLMLALSVGLLGVIPLSAYALVCPDMIQCSQDQDHEGSCYMHPTIPGWNPVKLPANNNFYLFGVDISDRTRCLYYNFDGPSPEQGAVLISASGSFKPDTSRKPNSWDIKGTYAQCVAHRHGSNCPFNIQP